MGEIQPLNRGLRILHIEAGTSFGGTTVILESYLRASSKSGLIHDVLFFHNIWNINRIEENCHRLFVLDTSGLPFEQGTGRSRRLFYLKNIIRKHSFFNNSFFINLYAFLKELLNIIRLEVPRAIRLMRIIKRGKYDLIHSNNTVSIQISSVIASKILRKPIVSHIRTRTELTFLQRFFANRVNYFISMSNSLKEDFIRQGISRKIIVCYEGVKIGKPDGARNTQRDGNKASRCIVGSAGRLVERKGFKYLIQAAKFILAEYPEASFVIIGDGEDRHELDKLSEDMGIKKYIDFTGFRNNVREIIRTFDVFVLPSLREGLPMVLLEAMAEGKPIVATSVDGIPELIRNGKTGLLVKPRNSQEIAVGVLKLLHNRDLAQRLGNNARRFVTEHGDMIETTKKIDEVFFQLLTT